VTLTDINDETNRLTVGIENLGIRGQVEELLEALDIPREAVEIEEIERFQLNQASTPPPSCTDAGSIRGRCRPLVGGLKINYQIFGASGAIEEDTCTLGVIAERNPAGNGQVGFVTASHCSNTMGDIGTVYYQPTSQPVINIIGTEIVDPPFCLPPVACRASDSNFSSLLMFEGFAAGLGYIARPDLNTGGGDCNVTPQLCAWNGVDTFRIVFEAYPIVGMGATKVGFRTGRTEGRVQRTDVMYQHTPDDISNMSYILRNQATIANCASDRGDSGSPVIWSLAPDPAGNPRDTALLGILWAGNTETNVCAFSPIQSVEIDLGPLNTCAPPFEC
jgi:hypothetical protein